MNSIAPYYEPTLNQYGFMLTRLDPFALRFLDFLQQDNSPLPALDVGTAYGIVTLEAHARDHKIIANDLCEQQLQILQERALARGLSPILTIPGDFFQLSLAPNSLSAIYISRVLHFLSGEDIIKALQLFHHWLIPGGKLFAISETPFFGTTAAYYPRYMHKKTHNDPWPGWIEPQDLDMYFDPHKRPCMQQTLHLLDEDTCIKCLSHTNFVVEDISYYNRKGFFPEDALFDGCESIGFIACKS